VHDICPLLEHDVASVHYTSDSTLPEKLIMVATSVHDFKFTFSIV
jgi:hypothetical protein